jgi:hypothetical protein
VLVRAILIPSSIAVFALIAAWLAAGPQISTLLDQFHTVPEAKLPLGQYGMDADSFRIGARGWTIAGRLKLAPDLRNRLTVVFSGASFTLGPISKCYGSANSYYDFAPDPSDRVSFEKSRSWLSWPTPFQFSIMGGSTTSWRRHSYSRLLWKKSSGAILELIWRDEQGYYPRSGWTDGNLQITPFVKIIRSRFEQTAMNYLASKKGWTPDTYRLEARGPSGDGKYEVIAAIARKDERATQPGAGESVDLYMDPSSGEVSKEVGGQ